MKSWRQTVVLSLAVLAGLSLAARAQVFIERGAELTGAAATLCVDATNQDACFERAAADIIQLQAGDSLNLNPAGVRLSSDGDGALTLLGLGDGSDEDLTINLDDTANTAVVSSNTGVTALSLSGIRMLVPDGAVDTPSLTFAADTGTGVFRSGTSTFMFVAGGNRIVRTAPSNFTAASDVSFAWNSAADFSGSTDLFLSRDAANTLALKNGNNNQTQRWYSANAGYLQVTSLNEAHTLALAATSDTTIAFPAASAGLSASFYITTGITGCTSVQVGIAGDTTRFGTFSTLTAGQTIAIARADNYTSATAIRFTAVGGGASFTAGAVRVVIHHNQASAPSS